MQTLVWWAELSRREKVRIARFLNGETGARWPLPGPAIRVFTKERESAARRIQLRLPILRVKREVRADRLVFVEHYRRVGQVLQWKYGVDLPADLRKCKYEKCGQFFVISTAQQLFHKTVCAHNYHAAKCMREKDRLVRDIKIERVRTALKLLQGRPDWKQRVVRKARVSPNFITRLIRTGEIHEERRVTVTIDETIKLALELYKSGNAVVLKDKNGNVIHGGEELLTLGSAVCRILPGIDPEEWKASAKYGQEILNGARLAWLRNKKQ